MPPFLASVLTVGIVAFLLWRDNREEPRLSGALWLPVIWMLIIGSRFVSQWLELFGLNSGSGSTAAAYEEGSSIDALVFAALILMGFRVLAKRRIRIGEVIRNNQWLTIYLLFCLVSVLWSDYPFVAAKRWIKVIGHPIMALIILTEPDRMRALSAFMKRVAIVFIPFSVLFVKYYLQYGRAYDEFGKTIITGITRDKNALGYVCMSTGCFWIWYLLPIWKSASGRRRRNELAMALVFLAMTVWLLLIADAKTALVTFVLSSVIVTVLRTRLIVKKYIGTYIVAAALIVAIADLAFGAYSGTIAALGRDPTLTDRTKVWEDVLRMSDSPVLGTGFESFWLGERLERLWAKWWWHPNQAHNGYIETYLNLGMVGVLLLVALIIATFFKTRAELLSNVDLGRFRLSLLVGILVFNYTDAIFKALHPLWFLFYVIAMDYPQAALRHRGRSRVFDSQAHAGNVLVRA